MVQRPEPPEGRPAGLGVTGPRWLFFLLGAFSLGTRVAGKEAT